MLFTILLNICSPASLLPKRDTNPFHVVQKHIEQLVADGKVPSVAVAVARDGEIIWEQGFGLADREKTFPSPNTPATLWLRSQSR